jgi:hypothetical protein
MQRAREVCRDCGKELDHPKGKFQYELRNGK